MSALSVLNKQRLPKFQGRKRLPTYWWKSPIHQRQYMDYLKECLGGTYESLYNVRKSHFVQTGGSSMLAMFSFSPALAVMRTYTEHDWKPWKFHRSPNKWWRALGAKFAAGDEEAISIVRQYMDGLAAEAGVTQPSDWQRVSAYRFGKTVQQQLESLGRLQRVLEILYPDLYHTANGKHKKQQAPKNSDQLYLAQIVKTLLPERDAG